tara:strand:+ start:824 stop:955 length:132 start_codon:yes stop_codon:yes gene_type:complete
MSTLAMEEELEEEEEEEFGLNGKADISICRCCLLFGEGNQMLI